MCFRRLGSSLVSSIGIGEEFSPEKRSACVRRNERRSMITIVSRKNHYSVGNFRFETAQKQ
jgi:hypothetical protein